MNVFQNKISIGKTFRKPGELLNKTFFNTLQEHLTQWKQTKRKLGWFKTFPGADKKQILRVITTV